MKTLRKDARGRVRLTKDNFRFEYNSAGALRVYYRARYAGEGCGETRRSLVPVKFLKDRDFLSRLELAYEVAVGT